MDNEEKEESVMGLEELRKEIASYLDQYKDGIDSVQAYVAANDILRLCAFIRDKETVASLMQKCNELMRSGNMSAAVKMYNRAWDKERGK